MARFPKTYCSQCAREFGPGDHGYSHCEDHQPKGEVMSKVHPIFQTILDAHMPRKSVEPFDRAELVDDIVTALLDVHDMDTCWNAYGEAVAKMLEKRGLIPREGA